MRDNDVNGKVDRVVATFNSTIESSTETDSWTLASVPSGGSKGTLTTSGSTATLLINEGAGAANTAVGSFTVELAQSGTGIRDAVGNQSTFAARPPDDKAVPIVTAIDRGAGGVTPTNAASVPFAVTFSEAVTAVDASDFQTSGTHSGASIQPALGGSGAGRTVTVNTGSGNGTLGLNLVDNGTILDIASPANQLGGAGSGNGNFTGQTYDIDKTAPQLVSLEMRDTDTNGKVDQVKATFDDALNTSYSAPNTVWTLANRPGGNNNTIATNGVSISGSTATLTLNQDTATVNTAAGTWGVAAAEHSPRLRSRWQRTPAGSETRSVTRQPSARRTSSTRRLQLRRSLIFNRASGTGPTANVPSQNDRFDVTFSEPLAVASLCSSWTGNTSNQNLTSNNQVTLRIKDNAAPNGNDQLEVHSIVSPACSTATNFGTLDLGSPDYVSTDQDSVGTGSGGRVELNWVFSSRELRFKLGAVTANAVTGDQNAIYTSDPEMLDFPAAPTPGNAAIGSASNNDDNHF